MASLSIVAAVAGCSSSDAVANPKDGSPAGAPGSTSQEPSVVYQFDDIKVADADDLFPSFAPSPTVVQLSEEMKNAAPELGETQLVQSYEITVKSFSTGICRLDVAIMYEGDGQKKVAAKWSDAELSYLRRCRSYFAIVASSAAGDTYRIKNLAEGADITGELTATSGVVNRASARRRASELRCTPPIPRARLA